MNDNFERELALRNQAEFLEILDDAWEVLMRANKKMYDGDFLSDELKEDFSQIRLELSKFYANAMWKRDTK